MNLDNELRPIINKVANENSIPSLTLIEAIEHLHTEVFRQFKSKEKRDILIHNFGKFAVNQRNVSRSIKIVDIMLEKDPTNTDLIERKEYLVNLRQQVIDNKQRRK